MLQIFRTNIIGEFPVFDLAGGDSIKLIDKIFASWDIHPLQKGVIMWYGIPGTLDDLKNPKYFNESNLFSKSFSFKIASQPFSAGVEKYAYFALNIKSDPTKEMVMKECLKVGERNNPLEKYLEAVEVSTDATTIDVRTRYYTIEPKFQNAECKRFNANSDVITELRPTLEAFAHFTYNYHQSILSGLRSSRN
ncbi:hypothetical protein C1646_753957 [Rhizophagus diaphanus]|nr:hypothetical protein C1646_753957 [Rhizophagus diaphanus] [Rhizophagus sp. MUCL 43196]